MNGDKKKYHKHSNEELLNQKNKSKKYISIKKINQ
jgi:hypothetical protein